MVTNSETQKGFRENYPFSRDSKTLLGFRICYYRKLKKGFRRLGNSFFAFKNPQRVSQSLSKMDLSFRALGNLFGRFPTRQKFFRVYDGITEMHSVFWDIAF